MGWSCGKNRRRQICKEIRCPERGGEKELRKTENVMGGLH